jgi:hypothetical protein
MKLPIVIHFYVRSCAVQTLFPRNVRKEGRREGYLNFKPTIYHDDFFKRDTDRYDFQYNKERK